MGTGTGIELPVIDRQRCTACGECVAICPDQLLYLGGDGFVLPVGDSCMRCGHCAAICPADAVTVPGLSETLGLTTIDEMERRRRRASVDIDELLGLMRQRRSCRNFADTPVAVDVLADLARIGSTAPSGTNSQPWRFVILSNRNDVERLGDATAAFYRRLNRIAGNSLCRLIDRILTGGTLSRYYRTYYPTVDNALRQWHEQRIDRLFHGAPAVIVVAADRYASCPAEDSLLATQNILLAAQALGLGTCLIGFAVEAARRDKRIGRLLRFGDNEQIYSVIACGYPAVRFVRPAGRKPISLRIF